MKTGVSLICILHEGCMACNLSDYKSGKNNQSILAVINGLVHCKNRLIDLTNYNISGAWYSSDYVEMAWIVH